jgi:FtsZ-interacting cell division protein ZipA
VNFTLSGKAALLTLTLRNIWKKKKEKEQKKKKKKKKKKKTQHHLSPLGGLSKEQAGLAAGQTEEVSLLGIYCAGVDSYESQKLER